MKKRVVVTGMGVVSSIGIGVKPFWKNLIAGVNGISAIETFDVSEYEMKYGGEIRNFRPDLFIRSKKCKTMGRASQFGVAAAKLALDDAEINPSNENRMGTFMGTTLAEAQSLEQIDKYWLKDGEDNVWNSNIMKYPGYNLANNISQYFGFSAANFVLPTACAAGNYSIGFAYDMIKQDKLDFAVAGGADPIARTNFTGFSRLVAMAPEKCQPFDKNRKGMMVGEGAGVLVVEELEHAINRGAIIYAEIMGYALSCDAYNMTIPSLHGIEKVMEKAIINSEVNKKDVGYICAHGTGTQTNDKIECEAIKNVFGNHTKELSVSSVKSMLGHTMGAASAIESIACCLAIREGIIPPTINYENEDVDCDLDCVPNMAKSKKLKVALNNSFAFGGNNACLVLGEYV